MSQKLPPANELSQHPLDRIERDVVAFLVGLLDRFDDFPRMEQSEIDRRTQKCVCHRPVVTPHRVLIRAKLREPMLDEVLEFSFGLRSRDWPD